MFKIRILILFTLAAFGHLSAADTFFKLPHKPLLIETNEVRLHGLYFPGAKKRAFSGAPILLTHGLSSNLHEFEFLIPTLVEAGFDCYAFNFRGHGNGAEQSEVLSYHEGDYQLWHMAETDFPLMVQYVLTESGKNPTVVGHSMGGMVPRAAFAHGRIDQSNIESLILIGSPPHFQSSAPTSRIIDAIGLNRLFDFTLSFGTGNGRVAPVSTMKLLTKSLDRLNLLNPIYAPSKWLVKNGALRIVRNQLGSVGDVEAISNWMDRAITHKLPKDILRSFSSYINKGYPYESTPVPVPVLHIVGESDRLVAWRDVVKSAQVQSRESGHWIVRVNGIGHFGLVTPWVIDGYMPSVLRFISAPRLLGPKNQTFLELDPADKLLRSCTNLLQGA